MNTIIKKHPLLKTCDFWKEPVTIHVSDFSEVAAKDFAKQMSDAQNTGQPVVPVVISSPGGAVYSLLSMIDTIKASPIPVATIAMGRAMSCGSVLLSCGTPGYRFVGEYAQVMVHEVAAGASHDKVEEIQATVLQAVNLNKILFSILDKNSNKPSGYFHDIMHDKCHADWFLSADEAIQHGLADHKRIPSLHVTVGVTWDFK